MERTHQNFIEVPLNCAGTSSSSSPRSTMNLQSYKAWIPTHNVVDLQTQTRASRQNLYKTVYALVQCSRDLSPDDCKDCLGSATEEILDVYYYSIGARLLSRSCYLRYELYAFYMGESSASMANDKNKEDIGRKRWKLALVAVAISCFVIVVLGSYACCYALNRRHKKRNNENPRQISSKNIHGDDQEFPYIGLASILAATNNFSDSNKLGEGGFGPVYQGVLRDGKKVAVKRLSILSEQGSEEFTNEVLLIMKLQHKNLVKLLGFCVDGEEKLLVYEYLPNKSLDTILLGNKIREILKGIIGA